jgi:sugar phosphate isomerase/epimerase
MTGSTRAQKPQIGIIENMDKDSVVYISGYHFITLSIATYFSPVKITDEQFEVQLQSLGKMKTRVWAANIFIPSTMKLVGPDVHEEAILSYAETVFRRCRAAGVTMIIWGSGGARYVPEGFDKPKAVEQFVEIARKLASLAGKYDITVALENLNHTETNFINTLREARDIVKAVNDPHLRLNADIYHMLKENEGPQIIETSGMYIVNCELAEKENRTPPGIAGDDFRSYFRALKKINYSGKISLECRWKNISVEAAPARKYLERQLSDVFQ